jgi:hypothetical protein
MDLKHPNEDHKLSPEQWEAAQFEGKEYCYLVDGYLLNLKATPYNEERTLSSVGSDNFSQVVQALEEKFKELEQQINEFEVEWEQAEDKLKLESKIARLKEFMGHTNALGNYVPLFVSLAEKEQYIQEAYAENYKRKSAIVERAEAFIQEGDQKTSSESWVALLDEWKAVPNVEKKKNDALWERFEKARNLFHERKHEYQDELNKERMQNLDLKMEICEEADQLAGSENWRATTEAFKTLFEKWKSIGPAPSAEKNEALWKQFNDARNSFFNRKKEHYEKIHTEQEANYLKKLALVERAVGLQDQTSWKETTQAFADLMTEWKNIGKVPYEKADELWSRLQASRDIFFEAKRASAQVYKATLEENFEAKKALVEKAERLQDSTDWSNVTQEMNSMMLEWKQGGPVPREYGDSLWERFLAARKHFFNCKDLNREKRHAQFHHQINNRLHQTVQFLNKIKKELEEEEEKLADFRSSLSATTGDSAKDEELRQHLTKLIEQIELTLPGRRDKIEEVAQQKAVLDEKCKEVNGKGKGAPSDANSHSEG